MFNVSIYQVTFAANLPKLYKEMLDCRNVAANYASKQPWIASTETDPKISRTVVYTATGIFECRNDRCNASNALTLFNYDSNLLNQVLNPALLTLLVQSYHSAMEGFSIRCNRLGANEQTNCFQAVEKFKTRCNLIASEFEKTTDVKEKQSKGRQGTALKPEAINKKNFLKTKSRQ